jgi:hypothetical protein
MPVAMAPPERDPVSSASGVDVLRLVGLRNRLAEALER